MHPPTSDLRDDRSPAQAWPEPAASTAAAICIDVHHGPPRPLVRVSGELDIAAVPLLVAMLDHSRRRHSPAHGGPQQRSAADVPVDVDLSRVTFADSHGLAPVLTSSAVIVSASPAVHRVLALLREVGPHRPARGSLPVRDASRDPALRGRRTSRPPARGLRRTVDAGPGRGAQPELVPGRTR